MTAELRLQLMATKAIGKGSKVRAEESGGSITHTTTASCSQPLAIVYSFSMNAFVCSIIMRPNAVTLDEIARHGSLPTVAPVNPYTEFALTYVDVSARLVSHSEATRHGSLVHLSHKKRKTKEMTSTFSAS